MRVAVVGCGIIGITTAWFLRRNGFDVQVFDRAEGPGRGTSFANGGLLHPSYVSPWNEPGILWQLLQNLGKKDAPIIVRPRHLSGYIGWGVRFIAHSQATRFARSLRSNLELAGFSRTVLRRLRNELGLNYCQYARGSLKIYRDEASLRLAADTVQELGVGSIKFSTLDRQALLALEPALIQTADQLAGALYFPDDEGGNAHRYCVEMARIFAAEGGRLDFGVEVQTLISNKGRLRALLTKAQERIEADIYVLACANETRRLLSGAGIKIPVRPVKGYSLTIPARTGAPKVPVIDEHLHAAIVPIGDDAIRIAGTAEFAGEDSTIPKQRVTNLFGLLNRIFPAFASASDLKAARPWTGHRPMSADGVPLIGRTRFANLYVNTGHGQIGWTTGPGSAKLLASLISGERPPLEPEHYAPDRFGTFI